MSKIGQYVQALQEKNLVDSEIEQDFDPLPEGLTTKASECFMALHNALFGEGSEGEQDD